jgi:hypothetical protein
MATDKREEILVQLVEVMKTVVAEQNVFRNKITLSEDVLPAIVVLDNDEVEPQHFALDGRQRPPVGVIVMDLQPEIFLVVQDKTKDIGTSLNTYRAKIIKAVLTDAKLGQLCKEILYQGFSTALNSGRSMQGQATVHMIFRYALRVDQL